MPALQHVYLTAQGHYTATPWIGETAQIGVRVVLSSDTPVPGRGTVWTLPTNNGDVTPAYATVAGANGVLTQQWTARVGPTGSTVNADAAMQIDLAEDLRTFLGAWATYMTNGFVWESVKIAPILANGKYGAPSSIYTLTGGVVGAGTNKALPPEVAAAVTWRAPVLGRRGRGRVYLPALTVDAITQDGILGTYMPGVMADAGVTLIDALDDFPGVDEAAGTLVIMSAGSATAVIPTEVRVGSHADSQRRRQDDVAEAYTVRTL